MQTQYQCENEGKERTRGSSEKQCDNGEQRAGWGIDKSARQTSSNRERKCQVTENDERGKALTSWPGIRVTRENSE